jgi:ribosomal protein S6--L-glutamate ligase
MVAALDAEGHRVRMVDPEAEVVQLGEGNQLEDLGLIVARGRSTALLYLLALAESRGVATLNCSASIAAVHNKARMAITLRASGITMPETFLGAVSQLAARVPRACYPLILKPVFGDNCRGLQVVRDREELARLPWPEPVALAQRLLPSDGYDLKLYGIGDEIWAVRKPCPIATELGVVGDVSSEPQVVDTTASLQALGRRCGRAFGLELYGVDCIETPSGPVVIEVNEFPNYTGVPDAGRKLAEYAAWRATRGEAA